MKRVSFARGWAISPGPAPIQAFPQYYFNSIIIPFNLHNVLHL